MALLASACSIGGGDVQVAAAGSEDDVLEAVREGWVSAYNAADAAGLAAYFADDAVMLAPGQEPLSSLEAIAQFVETFFEGEPAVLEIVRAEVRSLGNLAVERATYAVRTGEGSDAAVRTGKYVMVWQRGSDGDWKIVWDMWNGNEPLSAPAG